MTRPPPLEDDGALEGALGPEIEEEEEEEEEEEPPNCVVDVEVPDGWWLRPEYEAAATPAKMPVPASPPTSV